MKRSGRPAMFLAGQGGLLALCLFFALAAPAVASEAPAVTAESALLMDWLTGDVLYAKDADSPRPIASTTKIMTALIALERGKLDDRVVVPAPAVEMGESTCYLEPGETLTLEDLLKAMLLQSANDAAAAIAVHVDGTLPAFAARMNKRAAELGATHTHFVNPHGLHDPNHYSSARDLALITREAMRHPVFRQLVATKETTIPWPGKPWDRELWNHNRLLWRADFVDGVKTGWVRASGHCLVASGTQRGWRLISVVLNSEDQWQDSLNLLTYGFTNFELKRYLARGQVAGRARVSWGRTATVPALAADDLAAVVPRGSADPHEVRVRLTHPCAPLQRGERVGVATLTNGGHPVGAVQLLAAAPVGRSVVNWLWLGLKWASGVGLLAVLLAATFRQVRRYAKAAKSARRRRRSLPAPERGADPPGPSDG